MIGRHLLSSEVRVLRMQPTTIDGVLSAQWFVVEGMERIRCRIEVGFFRPGKDQMLPPQAGRAPDRVAVYWVAPGTELQAGDQLECLTGPVKGVWQIRTTPDVAQGMSRAHHLEGQAVEVHGSLQQSIYNPQIPKTVTGVTPFNEVDGP